MDLDSMISIDLQAWCDPHEDLSGLVQKVVDQLESGQGRAVCPAAGGGHIRWILDHHQGVLLVDFPNGTNRVRKLPCPAQCP